MAHTGTPENDGFLHLTCLKIPVKEVLEKAHEYNVSLTNFLCAVMMYALQEMQKEDVPMQEMRKPIKVLIPVNLRALFKSSTLRNFAMYATPEILPMLGEYEFSEICDIIKNCMGAEITPKQMSMKIAANIKSEGVLAIRMTPLFIKNMVMKSIFRAVGEKKSCITMSNLGAVRIPDAMKPYVERMDFILGIQSSLPYNCGVLSFGDTLYVNFIRNIKESRLEYHFWQVLRSMGISVAVESNQNDQSDQ